MEAASSSQNVCENTSKLLKIDASQFLEELMGIVLRYQQIEYRPVLTYGTQLGFVHLASIASAILDFFQIMSKRYERYIHEAVFTLCKNSKTEDYIELVGKRLLIDKQFDWKYFRVFLALITKLSDFCYRKKLIFLSDDIVITTARFIEKEIQSRVNERMGWKSFEDDCVKICLMNAKREKEERKKKPPKPPPSQQSMMPSTSRKLVAIHSCNFNNDTFGKCYVYESPEEYVEPIVYMGEDADSFQNIQPAISKEEHEMQMNDLVTESIEISIMVLREVSNEMET